MQYFHRVQYQLWQKQPVLAVITCHDKPGKSDGETVHVLPHFSEVGSQQYWSPGTESRYQRMSRCYDPTLAHLPIIPLFQEVSQFIDTAGNSTPLTVTNIGIDSVPPKSRSQPHLPIRWVFLLSTQLRAGHDSGNQDHWDHFRAWLRSSENNAAPALLYRVFFKNWCKCESISTNLMKNVSSRLQITVITMLMDNRVPLWHKISLICLQAASRAHPTTTTNLILLCPGQRLKRHAWCLPIWSCRMFLCDEHESSSNHHNLQDSSAGSHSSKTVWVFSVSISKTSCFQSLLTGNINTHIVSQYVPDTTAFSWNNAAYIKWTSF